MDNMALLPYIPQQMHRKQGSLTACVLAAGNKLGPEKTTLLTQQGGTLLFSGERTVLRQDDTGILKYAELTAFATEVQKLKGCNITTASQV